MKTFNEGDRVTHPIRGIGTVLDDLGSGWVTVRYDKTGEKFMTDVALLTPVPKTEPKFKIGERVSHPKGLHRDGIVQDYSEHTGLYTIALPGNRGYYALEHQITPTKPEPKFDVQILFTDGGGLNSGPLSEVHAEGYLTQLPDWDNVESITITRAKG